MNKSYNEYAKKFETQLRIASKTDAKKVLENFEVVFKKTKIQKKIKYHLIAFTNILKS